MHGRTFIHLLCSLTILICNPTLTGNCVKIRNSSSRCLQGDNSSLNFSGFRKKPKPAVAFCQPDLRNKLEPSRKRSVSITDTLGNNFSLSFEPTERSTLSTIRKRLSSLTGVNHENTRFAYKGEILTNTTDISEFTENLRILPPSIRGGDKISVQGMSGNIMTVEIDINDTVDNLKKKIQELGGMPPEEQRLIFNGKQLQDGHTLQEYAIKDKSKLHLVLRLRGGQFKMHLF